jgi:hypothetical protein
LKRFNTTLCLTTVAIFAVHVWPTTQPVESFTELTKLGEPEYGSIIQIDNPCGLGGRSNDDLRSFPYPEFAEGWNIHVSKAEFLASLKEFFQLHPGWVRTASNSYHHSYEVPTDVKVGVDMQHETYQNLTTGTQLAVDFVVDRLKINKSSKELSTLGQRLTILRNLNRAGSVPLGHMAPRNDYFAY